MKLHKGSYNECWAAALQILLGWKLSYIYRFAKKTREKYPYDRRGFRCKKAQMDCDFEGIYLPELSRILWLARGWRIRFKPVKKKINFFNFVDQIKEGTWLVFIKPDNEYHVAICQPGTVFDNQIWGENGVKVEEHRFRDRPVIQAARLPNFKIKKVY
jgi:hypothetical protein